ncbi:MAG: alpha/beta fold hydrolase [Betaproteobacteria bacterium]|nr:alpha/beta fold hydrolase [Betaproteobacteria bacterium]
MRISHSILAAALVASLTACERDATTTSAAGKTTATVAIEPCRVKGFDIEIKCAKLPVFEDREGKQGRKIDIHVAILPAKSDRKKPDPIFIFAGGPGQSAIEVGPRVLPALSRLNRERDLVFVDQRGTGKSNKLACKVDERDSLEGFGADAEVKAFIEGCLAEARKHADPRLYTTTLALQDLDDVRKALGYDKINLWGASYGTRAAFEYVRRFPQHTRSAVLDGMAPFDMALPLSFVLDSHASLGALLQACAKEAGCAKTFPNLEADLTQLVKSLDANPRRVTVNHPRTGEPIKVRVTGTMVLGGVRGAMYAPNAASAVPAAIQAAKADDFGPLAALGLAVGGAVMDELALGMHLSVVCAEDWPLVQKASAAAVPRAGLYGEELIRDHRNMCAVWPKGSIPADFHAPVKSDVPILILSGGVDPATPPRHAEAVLPGLSRAKHVVAPNIGHGVSPQGCAPDLIKRFVEDGNADKVDGACLAKLPRPVFFQPLAVAAAPGNPTDVPAEKDAQK